jgi:hypothetical protein
VTTNESGVLDRSADRLFDTRHVRYDREARKVAIKYVVNDLGHRTGWRAHEDKRGGWVRFDIGDDPALQSFVLAGLRKVLAGDRPTLVSKR